MKRFFQPVQKDGSFKKRGNGVLVDEKLENGEKVEKLENGVGGGGGAEEGEDPAKFLSWNANSFLLRVKNNRAEVFELVRRCDPDVIALQEVRVPAAGRNPSAMKDDTGAARADQQAIFRALSEEPLSEYQAWWSLAGSKYSGTALLIKKCFKPISVTFSLDMSAAPGAHESDGRVIIAEFKTFRLLNTYVPNNGWKDEELGFKRRRQWDKRVFNFVTQPCKKPIIWCGDLNVSHQDVDVTDPEFFRNAKQKGYIPPNKEDIGQPGFTPAERQRFSKVLADGDLVDSYRWLHKGQEFDSGFTWSGNPVGMYRGKRMRIDYFLIPRQLVGRLLRSDILGSGIELEGFCGSDHSPITLELTKCSKDVAEAGDSRRDPITVEVDL
ncbi:unnamed protein product [Calypogeia fissa]